MATITLKGVPSSLHRALKRRAAKNRRSLNSEILIIFEEAYGAEAKTPEAIRLRAKRLRDSQKFTTTPEEIDAAKRAGRE